MKRLELMTLTVLMMSILLLSTACHKIGPGKVQFIVYVNEKDNRQILGFEASPQPLRQWWHGEPRDPSPQGQYFRNDGKQDTSGSYWMDGNVFVVNDARFSIQPNLSIRDGNGVIWQRTDVNGPAIKHAEMHVIRK